MNWPPYPGSTGVWPTVGQPGYEERYRWDRPMPWDIPDTFAPLPPSPSQLRGAYGYAPSDSHNARNPNNYYTAGQTLPHYDPFYDPYAGDRYLNNAYMPQTQVNCLLNPDLHYLIFDLASSMYLPYTPTGHLTRSIAPLHQGYLEQIAAAPAVSRMTITCSELAPFDEEWRIHIAPGRPIVVGDVLYAVYSFLQQQMPANDYRRLTHTEVKDVDEAYRRRVETDLQSPKYVIKSDMLRDRHYFGGIFRRHDDDPVHYKLVVRGRR